MDSDSQPDEPTERAVSSEPTSTRPNPFDDSDQASRKRRRTSHTDTGSRSRSVDTVKSTRDPSVGLDPEAHEDNIMKIDTDPTTPQTPECLPESDRPPAEPTSSRVTLNLRSSRQHDTMPSSPPSPIPATKIPGPAVGDGKEVELSVEGIEGAEVDMAQAASAIATPLSSASGVGSPPVEIVSPHADGDGGGGGNNGADDGNDDDRMAFGNGQSPITILSGGIMLDPAPEIPFHDFNFSYAETISNLAHYISTHGEVVERMRDWLLKYLDFLATANQVASRDSYEKHHPLWHALPDVIWGFHRKTPLMHDPQGRSVANEFLMAFARLAAHFLNTEIQVLRRLSQSAPGPRLPTLVSPGYVTALNHLSRRDDPLFYSGNASDADMVTEEISEILEGFMDAQNGAFTLLTSFADIHILLVPRFPKLIENLGSTCQLVNIIVRESIWKFQSLSRASQDVARPSALRRLKLGHGFYQKLAGFLSTTIDKYVNHLSKECAVQQILSLSEIHQQCLVQGEVQIDIKATLSQHRQTHPNLPPACTPEAISLCWRFAMYAKLIKSSQMQLRVMAVSNMCSDLVGLWKRYSEHSSEQGLLYHFADFLLQTGLVAYILGPTCHPEITTESSNIIGFLVVTKTYTDEHTDQLWHTVTSSQDPRVSDALLRMFTPINNLMPEDRLLYFCKKLHELPIEYFTPATREFCESVFRGFGKNIYEPTSLKLPPYNLCLRLLRESSVCGAQSAVAYPDIQEFATVKFRDLLSQGPDDAGRQEIYASCLQDISQKSDTSLGSLWVIYAMVRALYTRELHILATEHDFARLLADELESSITKSKDAGFSPVISGKSNTPRRELIWTVVSNHPATISPDIGVRLWNLLVGTDAICREDRDAAWETINRTFKQAGFQNPFFATCFRQHLPTLLPQYFCDGALEFIKEGVLPRINGAGSIMLDDVEDEDAAKGIEQLWRMILTAPSGTIETKAIHTLVNDLYIDSRSISTLPLHQVRKVHLALVSRCLLQLDLAGTKLRSFADGTMSGDDEPMIIVASDGQVREQELVFIRSLYVLKEFHRQHRNNPHFAAPDLRALSLESPGEIEGQLAELKYQTFDGNDHSAIRPLDVGVQNTVGDLLARIKRASGFDNYQVFYRGTNFLPCHSDINKSLHEQGMASGLLLIKREADAAHPSERTPLGASPVEIAILSRFDELWEYLSMEETLAQEVYNFLIKLPADGHILASFQSASPSHNEIFPPGQSFKSLYAIHTLQEFLSSQRMLVTAFPEEQEGRPRPDYPFASYPEILAQNLSLVVAAILDPDVISRCASEQLQIMLTKTMMHCLAQILKDPLLPTAAGKQLDSFLLDRLLEILATTAARSAENITTLVGDAFEVCLESSALSREFWVSLKKHGQVGSILRTLLLEDSREPVRQTIAKHIADQSIDAAGRSEALENDFRDFIWPIIFELLEPAAQSSVNCEQVFALSQALVEKMTEEGSVVLNVQDLLLKCSRLLLAHSTCEDVTKPEVTDFIASGLVSHIHLILCSGNLEIGHGTVPLPGFAKDIFWKHLFPLPPDDNEALHYHTVLDQDTRNKLCDIVMSLVGNDQAQFMTLLEDLDSLVEYNRAYEDDNPYSYELPSQFERMKAVRSPAGYAGLKNLSNTCYLNSLFTQLFMNVEFRHFMLNADIQDPDCSQLLLDQTQKLFGFMQESIQRFIDPTKCVASIKTYDDGQIDIFNQMDVDEFYNLLFDRWEGQLFTADAKRAFRSFYGGQLVQQVKSKECEHISERLEPFSAIQCDIKGKNNLQESLQAYVDGEIMEGDNKYKCSTCDRHVDAVKRACLKDMPDNLIFHLKRFDFNLRTLQRSKINDHFTFPTRIDMRPYTINYLSDTPQDATEDVFELVGVLVHSGTAESGHYYSYIRERPTRNASETWVEFNDDVVTPWDPLQMEHHCFGGQEYRPYDNSNIVCDKTYSAYMLFYQRSSCLRREQTMLAQSTQAGPLRMGMPCSLAEEIKSDNIQLLSRHCLFDPNHITFVRKVLALTKAFGRGGCSPKHRVENASLQLALSHLDQVASRAKDIPDFSGLLDDVLAACKSCAKCCLSVFDYFNARQGALRALVQRNNEPYVRQWSARLFILVLELIKEQCPDQYGILATDDDDMSPILEEDTIIHGVVCIFRRLWDTFHTTIRSWPEFFGMLLEFAKLGRHEIGKLLEEDFLKRLLMVISADPNLADQPTQYARMINTVVRRLATTRPPSYDNIIALTDTLMSVLQISKHPAEAPRFSPSPDVRFLSIMQGDEDLWYTRSEFNTLTRDWSATGAASLFVEKLITVNQNPHATESIISRLVEGNHQVDARVQAVLLQNILGEKSDQASTPYLRAALTYCRVSTKADRIRQLIAHICRVCQDVQTTEGRSFFEFQRTIFDMPRDNSGETEDDIYRQGLANIPIWVPGLLGSFDQSVRGLVEEFLAEQVFRHARSTSQPQPQPQPQAENGELPTGAVDEVGKRLGITCLRWLQTNTQVARDSVSLFKRTINRCQPFFPQDQGPDDPDSFLRLRSEVFSHLNRLPVDELEDDASEWENSCGSSEPMESLGDISMQTANDLNDGDL